MPFDIGLKIRSPADKSVIMSISAKTTLLILLAGLLLSLSAYVIQRNIVFPAFHEIEIDYAQNSIDRVIRKLEAQRDIIDLTVYDWSAWDDTYAFIQDGNQEYQQSNLQPDTFRNFGYEVALFMDLDRELVWGRVFDFTPDGEIKDLSDRYLDEVATKTGRFADRLLGQSDIETQTTSAIIIVDEIPLLFAMRPVIRSDGTGPHKGYLVFGQFLNDELIATFSEQIVQEFRIEPVSAAAATDTDNSYTVDIIDASSLAVSKVFSIEGVPSLWATATLPRNITMLGREITYFGFSAMVVLSLFLASALLAFFKWLFVRPITALRSDISHITNVMDYSLRTRVLSNDEIGTLSQEFNFMLARVEAKNAELMRLHDQLSSEHQKVLDAQSKLRKANAVLKTRSEIDPLTGLSNRLALEKKLEHAWEILLRTGDSLTVMLVDIDHFKAFNDRYGHQAGDDALKKVAAILASAMQRRTDMAARYGGEEFLLVLPGTRRDDALNIAAALKERIIAANIRHGGSSIEPCLTISIGISSVVPSAEYDLKNLIKAADNALYKVKENGRNNIGYESITSVATSEAE